MLRRGNIWRREEAMGCVREGELPGGKLSVFFVVTRGAMGVIGLGIEVVGRARERPKSATKRYAGRPRLTLLT